jgi:hypothetical protein
MKKLVTFKTLEVIDLEGVEFNTYAYDGSSGSKDFREGYIKTKKELKERIIKTLSECDDFDVSFSEDHYWGSECKLTTYKVDIESDEDFEKRKIKISKKNKKAAETRKKKAEEKEKEEYLRLKEKFENKEKNKVRY